MACERREGPGDTLAVLLVAARALRVDRAARRQPGGLFTGSGGLAVLRLTGRIPLRHGGREGIDHAALGDKLDGVVDEIGRASCRGRVESSDEVVAVYRKDRRRRCV